MKRHLLLTLLTVAGYTSQAQDAATPLPKTYSKEIGILGQQSGSSDDDIAMMGINFKKWKNPNFGFRVIAAYGGYSSSNNYYTNRYQIITPDTIVEKYHLTDIAMGMIGFGVEAQRTFYKRVVLFAAMELRGGYGSGKQDEYEVTRYGTRDSYYENSMVKDSRDASMIYMAMAPTIGAKIQFKRVNFGVETTGINMSYKGIKVENQGGYGTMDFNVGDFTHRAFINYNF